MDKTRKDAGMNKLHFFIILLLFWTITSCKTQKVKSETFLVILDSLKASKEIIVEDRDVYFKKLQPLEIAIMMNKETPFSSQNNAQDSLVQWLGSQVLNFTHDDKTFIDSVFTEAKKRIKALNPELMPDTIKLVKINPAPYGEKVYFTRNKTIYFPQSAFTTKSFEKELAVMVHEIWHVISRLHPELRDKTYPLIGFEKHKRSIKIPEDLSKKVITNPDASFMDYAVDLDGTLAIPLLTSKFKAYTKANPYFFDYVDFNLFPILKDNSLGTKGILDERTDVFFRKIKDNTNYIIHPEEIIAENFQLLVYANYENRYDRFSNEGKDLILQLKKVLEQK